MKQKDIAIQVGYSLRHINQVLRGNTMPSTKLAKKLESVLGIPWTSWFEEKPVQPKPPAPANG